MPWPQLYYARSLPSLAHIPCTYTRRAVIMAMSQNYYRYEYVVIPLFGYFLVLFWFLCCWLPSADCRLLVRIKFIVYAQYTTEWVGWSVGRLPLGWLGAIQLLLLLFFFFLLPLLLLRRQSCLERRSLWFFFQFHFVWMRFQSSVCATVSRTILRFPFANC